MTGKAGAEYAVEVRKMFPRGSWWNELMPKYGCLRALLVGLAIIGFVASNQERSVMEFESSGRHDQCSFM